MPGTLELTFTNGVLYQTIFVPSSRTGYLALLAEAGTIPDRDPGWFDGVYIWTTPPSPSDDSGFVGWRDRRITRQLGAWIARCT